MKASHEELNKKQKSFVKYSEDAAPCSLEAGVNMFHRTELAEHYIGDTAETKRGLCRTLTLGTFKTCQCPHCLQ